MSKIELYHGNCLDVMSSWKDCIIDLTITSPPYDNLRTYNGSLDWGEHVWKPIIDEIYRVTKDGGVCVWVVNDATINGSETGTSFKQALYFKETGFNIHDTMIWNKNSCRYPETNRYYPSFEYMFVFSKKKPKTYNLIKDRQNKHAGAKLARKKNNRGVDGVIRENSAYKNEKNRKLKEYGTRYNIWNIDHSGTEGSKEHPATFPEHLVNDHIISWSSVNDTVLDLMMGSGTTGVACKNLNRNFIGIEKDETYFNLAKNRIENHVVEHKEFEKTEETQMRRRKK